MPDPPDLSFLQWAWTHSRQLCTQELPPAAGIRGSGGIFLCVPSQAFTAHFQPRKWPGHTNDAWNPFFDEMIDSIDRFRFGTSGIT